jgi:hypothetical protein
MKCLRREVLWPAEMRHNLAHCQILFKAKISFFKKQRIRNFKDDALLIFQRFGFLYKTLWFFILNAMRVARSLIVSCLICVVQSLGINFDQVLPFTFRLSEQLGCRLFFDNFDFSLCNLAEDEGKCDRSSEIETNAQYHRPDSYIGGSR